MNEYDHTYLRIMLREARQARKFLQGRSYTDLRTDDLLSHAVVHAIKIIDVTGTKVSIKMRSQHPQIDWGNRIDQEYDKIDLDIAWEIVNCNLPKLIVELERILLPE